MNIKREKYFYFLTRIILLATLIYCSCPIFASEPETAEEWFNKAKKDNDQKLKIEFYSKAIELDSKYVDAYVNRAIAYYNLGKYRLAMDDYTKAIELKPNDPSIYNRRGYSYYLLGEYRKLLSDYTKAIKLDSASSIYYVNRGNAFYRLEEYLKAIIDYSRAIENDPKYAWAYYNRGNAYLMLEEFDKKAFGESYLAGLFVEQKNKNQALICLEKMKEINPSSFLNNALRDKIGLLK